MMKTVQNTCTQFQMAIELSVEEVMEEVLGESGEESVMSESETKDQRERVLLDPNLDAIVSLKTKSLYAWQLLIGESLVCVCSLSGRRRIQQPFTNKIYRGTCHLKSSVS
jgi:hypothetical protein